MFTYAVLHFLPPVPEHFIKAASELNQFIETDIPEDNLSDTYKNRKLTIGDKTGIPVTYQTRMDINQQFYDWVHEHIDETGFDCGVSFTSGHVGRYQGPHTDLTRDYTLLYLIEPGGPNTQTVFYREKGQPIQRTQRQVAPTDFNNLEVLERVKFPVGKWTLLNAMALHGVEEIETCRISFQVSLNRNKWFESIKYAI